jgi:imidazolonepropionase-like amidohydrolase
VTIAFGSDIIVDIAGQTRGSAALSLLDSWTKAGIPPLEILKALTTNGARLLGLERERGALRPGLVADIIATAQNPAEDIRALRGAKFVMKEGRVIRSIR